jgi:hypothetical protein
VSFIQGRVRVRAPGLRDAGTLSGIQGMLAAQDGVLAIKGNARVGSLLVLYDPARIPQERLEAAVSMLEGMLSTQAEADMRPAGILSQRCENRLLLAIGLLCLIGAACGQRLLHVASGSVCTLLAAKHLIDRRKSL